MNKMFHSEEDAWLVNAADTYIKEDEGWKETMGFVTMLSLMTRAILGDYSG